LWIAPNVITLLGLSFEFVSFAISYHLSEGLTKPLPGAACVFNAVCLSIYHTLDSLDGKQARRTGSSSPLGQFFDHGCDALTTIFEMVKVAATLQLGPSMTTFVLIFITSVGFFFNSFQEFVTDCFYMGFINASAEGLVLLSLTHLTIGLFPCLLPLVTSKTVRILYVLGGSTTILSIIYDCAKQSISNRVKLQKSVIGIVPALVTITLFTGYVTIVDPKMAENLYFAMAAGFVLEYQAQQGIVGHLVGRSPWKTYWEPGIAVVLGVALIPAVVSVPETFWMGYLALVVGLILQFDLRVVQGFSGGLHIPVLTLPKGAKK
jgi:phosphatidylglycerophosphate synthase